MKTLITILAGFIIIGYTSAASAQRVTPTHATGFNRLEAAIHPDKIKHFAAGAIIGGSVQAVAFSITHNKTKSMLLGFGAGCAAGIAKELYDMTGRGCASVKDALWTGIGAGLATVTLRFTLR